MSRTLAREDAFKLIFEIESTKISAKEALEYFIKTVDKTNDMWAQKNVSAASEKYINNVVLGVESQRLALIEKIEKTLKGWTIGRISKVNLALLLLATYEIFYISEIPDKVSANEAVELAKKYSGKEDSSFINGVLGTLISLANGQEGKR